MSVKKLALIVGMALAALAVPASASGATLAITDAGATVHNHTVKFNGTFAFKLLGSGTVCTNVDVNITINTASVEVEEFVITNPTTECHFEGIPYANCEFEAHPHTNITPGDGVGNPTELVLDLQSNATHTEEWLTVTTKTNGEPGRITMEQKSKVGKNCPFTTSDIRIAHEAGSSVKLNIETSGGFVSALELTGSMKIETGGSAGGTVVTTTSTAAASGTLKIEAAKVNTYTVGTEP